MYIFNYFNNVEDASLGSDRSKIFWGISNVIVVKSSCMLLMIYGINAFSHKTSFELYLVSGVHILGYS